MRLGLLSIWLLASMASSCFAIQKNKATLWLELLSNQPVKYSHGFDLSGRLSFREYPDQLATHYTAADFYLHPIIIDELQLDRKKRIDIENAFKQMRSELNEKILELSQTTSSKDRKSKLTKLDDYEQALKTKLAERIGSALSNSQKKRLRQIQFRFLIHLNGFYQTVNDNRIQKLYDTPTLDAEKFKVSQTNIAKTIVQKNRKLANEAFADLISNFNKKQRKVFLDRWGAILDRSSGTQQLTLQLDSKIKPTKFDPQNPFDLSRNWSILKHDAAGRCVFQQKNDSKLKLTPLAKLRQLQRIVNSQHFKRDIELVHDQVNSLKELGVLYFERKMVLNQEIGKKHRIKPRIISMSFGQEQSTTRLVYTLKTTAQLKEFERRIAPIADEYYEKYLDVFLPHQLEMLEVVVGNMNTRLQGPLAEVLWGDVGKALKLTDAEKELFKKSADEIRKSLESDSKAIYDEAIDQLINMASENNRRKIQTCLGVKFKTLYPNLDGFAVALLTVPVAKK